MADVHRPPTLTLRSRTGAAKPTLWPTLNPCHFNVPCFIFKTKTFSFSSKQALSNNVFGVKIGRTTTLRRLFKVINFRRSKFVCTLWPCPVFAMCAAGLATHLTTPVCPVARTQTIILQVVYSLWEQFESNNPFPLLSPIDLQSTHVYCYDSGRNHGHEVTPHKIETELKHHRSWKPIHRDHCSCPEEVCCQLTSTAWTTVASRPSRSCS